MEPFGAKAKGWENQENLKVSHKGLFQTVPDFSIDSIHVQNKWSCLNVVNQVKVRVTVVILMIFFNVAVYRSTRAGKRLFIKAGTSTVYVK